MSTSIWGRAFRVSFRLLLFFFALLSCCFSSVLNIDFHQLSLEKKIASCVFSRRFRFLLIRVAFAILQLQRWAPRRAVEVRRGTTDALHSSPGISRLSAASGGKCGILVRSHFKRAAGNISRVAGWSDGLLSRVKATTDKNFNFKPSQGYN